MPDESSNKRQKTQTDGHLRSPEECLVYVKEIGSRSVGCDYCGGLRESHARRLEKAMATKDLRDGQRET